MNAIITSIILGLSIILEIYLELKGVKVPAVVYLLSGFGVRHIIGGDTAVNAPTTLPVALVTQTTPIVEQPEEVKP
jgi:hypothetical protein